MHYVKYALNIFFFFCIVADIQIPSKLWLISVHAY
jgi:hypothetical protein